MTSIMEQNERRYLHTTCDFCKKGMVVTEGSVIVGVKWYHPVCFAQAQIGTNKTASENGRSILHRIDGRTQTIPDKSGDTN